MSNSIYFKNLTAVRFFAAFLVIIHHYEQFRSIFGLKNYWQHAIIKEIGSLGVTLFFTLSGFLITYLLLVEKDKKGAISVRNFYMRRILRIWPLYFLIVLIGLFILPHFKILDLPNYDSIYPISIIQILLFFFFVPNFANAIYTPVPFVSQTWSVGVEEQFYLIWPVLINVFKRVLPVLLSVIFISFLFKIVLLKLSIGFPRNIILIIANAIWETFRVQCMSIGGVSAFILFTDKQKLLNILFSKTAQITIYSLTVFFILTAKTFYLFTHEVYSILFSLIILNLGCNKNSILNLEFQPFNYLGKISYGLYMYHGIAIVICIKIALTFNIENSFLMLSSSCVVTFLFSALSFELLEKKLLNLKKHFTNISNQNSI